MQHPMVERRIGLMGLLIVLVISVGGLVEILPLLGEVDAGKPVEGVTPLAPLALAGRDLYIRDGCHVCHTQMVRPLRAETERYGHYSVAGESVYEHPFLWGSKRTGPDLARVGARYGDDWHRTHLLNPRDVVPESNMPAFPWLAASQVDGATLPARMRALRSVGVPYTDEDIAAASAVVEGRTEMDAMVAYLQQLGTALKTKR